MVVGAMAALTITSSALGAGPHVVPVSPGTSAADRAESASVALQALVDRQGGLGVFRNTSGWVVARPSSGGENLTARRLSALGLAVRVEQKATSKATIDGLRADLEALHGAARDAFAFAYDPATGKVVVRSAAPASLFASLQRRYPGLIDLHAGVLERTADWANDVEPHWGGGWIQTTVGCTSAFAIEDGRGHRFMVTAGHCFTHGAITNMGRAVRPSHHGPWSDYDVELITGRRYAGVVYETPSTGRKVKNGTNPGVGNQYCTTGRTSGFQCEWTVHRLNETICYPDQPACSHGLAGMTRPSGVPVQSGDSGGPLWYRYGDGTAGVRGVISGRFWDVGTFSWYSWVTQYQPIANAWAMHAVTP